MVAALAGAGRLLDAASLGEILARHGLALAVLGCGTAGGNRILPHPAAHDGSTVNVSAHGADRSATPQAAEALFQRVGRPPEKGVPDGARLAWLAGARIGDVLGAGDLTVDEAVIPGLGEQPQWHYGVVFDGRELWGEASAPGLQVSVDAWESTLEPA